MLYQVIIVIHILLGLCIIGLVLMQQGKGADAGAAFGSGASGSVFGAQGSATFLSKSTAVFAALFFMTSLGLAIMGGIHHKKTDLIETISVEETKPSVPSDVPLSQIKSSADEVPVEMLPEAPVIKEVEKSPDEKAIKEQLLKEISKAKTLEAPAIKEVEKSPEAPAKQPKAK